MRLKLGPHDKNLNDSSSTRTMRKYYQLALAVISVLSVVTLLFYRHEYNRLRYVLEVLNFFGKPGTDIVEPSLCLPANASFLGKDKFHITTPLPVWQRLTDTHYVYSAFWETSDKDRWVKTLSYGVEQQEISLDFGCRLWFDDGSESVAAQFSFTRVIKEDQSKTTKTSSFVSYELFCRPAQKSTVGVPYGVSFFKTVVENSGPLVFVPVHFSQPVVSNTTSVCVVPTAELGVQKSTIVEFLSYYQILGASQFIVYNSGALSRVVPALTDPSVQERLGISIFTLPWNFPHPHSSSFARSVLERDCVLRTTGKSLGVAVVDWNEYVVPKYHSSLPTMLGDLGRNAYLFKVMVAAFCTQLFDNPQSAPDDILALRKTHFVSEPELSTHIYQPGQPNIRTQRILPGIAVVHRYVQCTEQQLSAARQSADSTSTVRFASDLSKSRILKAWRSGYLLL